MENNLQKKATDDLVKFEDASGNEVKLSSKIIRKYLAPNNLVTDQEVMMFLSMCKFQKLNPFLKEAYLIKYSSDRPATIVTGKEAFLKRAANNPNYAGHKTWIEGEGNNMIAKAEVYVNNYKIPVTSEVDYSEYVQLKNGKPNAQWSKRPKTMLKKVALVHALREAFPKEFGGMIAKEEHDKELDFKNDYKEPEVVGDISEITQLQGAKVENVDLFTEEEKAEIKKAELEENNGANQFPLANQYKGNKNE